ncbi:hypothetical protein [Sphingopyxis alaskensis]|uniref:hypothetical protein n=1 Tax=Sphingopyxis alaskensis TaxID=117207 RepID=UPI00203DCA92|nr:hypothetical protein [Sphingopyxis alaskensis]MCM3420552.1 hypothetical protein [Sphingopyxis alaskensis]
MGINSHFRVGAGIIFAVNALCFGEVSARESPASYAEKEAAMRAYMDCRIIRAQSLDDGISDAITIGRVVAAACQREMEQAAAVLTQGENARVRSMLTDRMSGRAAEDAATIVLLERKRKVEQEATGQ